MCTYPVLDLREQHLASRYQRVREQSNRSPGPRLLRPKTFVWHAVDHYGWLTGAEPGKEASRIGRNAGARCVPRCEAQHARVARSRIISSRARWTTLWSVQESQPGPGEYEARLIGLRQVIHHDWADARPQPMPCLLQAARRPGPDASRKSHATLSCPRRVRCRLHHARLAPHWALARTWPWVVSRDAQHIDQERELRQLSRRVVRMAKVRHGPSTLTAPARSSSVRPGLISQQDIFSIPEI